MTDQLLIRELQSHNEFEEIHNLQRAICGISEREAVDPNSLRALAKNGAVILGVFNEQTGEMLAFIFDFPGLTEAGHIEQYSYMMGVHPNYRNKGIGFRLKLEERTRIKAQGLDLVRWNLDPLNGAFATLSFKKLGALGRHYEQEIEDFPDGPYENAKSRQGLTLEWWIDSPRVNERLDHRARILSLEQAVAGGATLANQAQMTETGLRLTAFNLKLADPALLIEIPGNLNEVELRNPNFASEWRSGMRDIFGNYLTKGYVVADFFGEFQNGYRRNFYLVRHSRGATIEELAAQFSDAGGRN
jgi:predicted GNAT superfamily acetyltransferase